MPNPALLLKRWWKRSPDLFAGESGPVVNRFIETPRPIRVWYNAGTAGADGTFLIGLLDPTNPRARPFDNEVFVNTHPPGSKLTISATRNILSVIVIVDAKGVGRVTASQLADYVGLVGMAQINLDKNLGDAPTILKLFSASEDFRPAGITTWDQALLHALYSTRQTSPVQKFAMQTVVLQDLTTHKASAAGEGEN